MIILRVGKNLLFNGGQIGVGHLTLSSSKLLTLRLYIETIHFDSRLINICINLPNMIIINNFKFLIPFPGSDSHVLQVKVALWALRM